MITARLTVTRNGETLGELSPAKWFYRKHESEPTTEVAIRRGPAEDLYIVLAGFDVERQSATLHVVVNPLVNWIWLGFGVLAFGTIIALLPEKVFAVALAACPRRRGDVGAGRPAAGRRCAARARAASGRRERGLRRAAHAARARSAEGDHLHVPRLRPPAPERVHLQSRRQDAEGAGGAGRSRARAASRSTSTSSTSGAARNRWPARSTRGFNRLAWAFPYAIGLLGLGIATAIAVRWSRSQPTLAATAPTPIDPALEQRLADELRDLD